MVAVMAAASSPRGRAGRAVAAVPTVGAVPEIAQQVARVPQSSPPTPARACAAPGGRDGLTVGAMPEIAQQVARVAAVLTAGAGYESARIAAV